MPIPGTVLFTDTVYGTIFYFGFDGPIGDALRLYGQWAKAEIDFLCQFIPLGGTVVDGGANVGTHSLGFAKACGPDGRVVAIEASPEIAGLLEMTIKASELRQIELLNVALGADGGTCIIRRLDPKKPQNAGMLQAIPSEDSLASGLSVERVTLDSIALDTLSFLKLDIEGSELGALKGGIETIKRLRPVISVEILSLSASLDIIEFLKPFGYKPFFCSFAVYAPDNFKSHDENIFGVAREAMLLLLPNASVIPDVSSDTFIAAINDADDLAQLISEMPRYGDRSDHDRVLNVMIEEKNRLEDLTASLDDKLSGVRPELMGEIRHLWHHLEKIRSTVDETVDRMARAEAIVARHEDALTGLAASSAVVSGLDERTVSLKAEITSLREVFFERDENRNRIVLELERLEHRTKADLSQESGRLDERIDALGGDASAGTIALNDTLRVIRQENADLASQVCDLQRQIAAIRQENVWRRMKAALGIGSRRS